MKLMFLLLEHQICSSSTTVKFFTTKPSSIRTYTVLLSYMINENDNNPYYDDTITKYFSKPISLNSKLLLISNTSKSIQSFH